MDVIGHKFNAKHRFDQRKQNIIKHKHLLSYIKMGKENLMFGDVEIEKNTPKKFTAMKVLFF